MHAPAATPPEETGHANPAHPSSPEAASAALRRPEGWRATASRWSASNRPRARGEIGAGIQIGTNAFHCIDYLGAGDEARAKAVYIDALHLMDAQTGDDIASIPLDDAFCARFTTPDALVHRVDLHGSLLAFCETSPLMEICTGHAATGHAQNGHAQNGDPATLHVRGRADIHGHAVTGAEGLRSPIRAQMIGDGDPRISRHTAWRSVIPTALMPEDLRWNAATLWAGPKCHIVHYSLKGGNMWNLAVTCHRDLQKAIAGRPVPREDVMKGLEHNAPRAHQFIEHGTDWTLWVLCGPDPISNWIDG